MKTIFPFIIICFVAFACGNNSQLNEADNYEIQNLRKNYSLIYTKYDNLQYEDYKETREFEKIKKLTDSDSKEVAKQAKLYLDSIEQLNHKVFDDYYSSFFEFAEENGWNKLTKEEFLKLEKSFKTTEDEFSSSSLYRHPSSPKHVNDNGFFLFYTKTSEGMPLLSLRSQYQAENWLFIENAKISIDGNVYSLNFDNWKHDNADGEIFEWGTMKISHFNILTHILKGKSIKIRYTGDQYFKDIVLNNSQKNAIHDVLKVYYGLYLKERFQFEK